MLRIKVEPTFRKAKKRRQRTVYSSLDMHLLFTTTIIVISGVSVDVSAATGHKSAIAQQTGKHSVIRSSQATQRPVAPTVALAAKRHESLKHIKPNKPNRRQIRKPTLEFVDGLEK